MPPPERSLETAPVEQALHMIRGAALNMRMYPRESTITQSALRMAVDAIHTALVQVPEIMVSDTDDGLSMDGNKPLKVNNFRELMATHGVRNIRFTRGVTLEEMSAFCQGLGSKKDKFGPQTRLIAWLKAQGVQHILADDVRYIDVKEDERVVLRGKGQISVDEDSTVMQSLKDTLRRIEKIPDPSVHPLLRQEIAKEMAEFTPAQLLGLYTHNEAESGPIADILKSVTESLPLSKVEEIFRFIVEQQHQIKVHIQAETDRTQRISLLRGFMRQILSAPSSREIPPHLYTYLSAIGLLESGPTSGLKGGEYFSFTALTKNLLVLPGAFLVTQPLCDHLLELVKNLCVRASDGPLEELTDKILQNLEEFDDTVRIRSIQLLAKIHSILAAHGKTAPADRLLRALSAQADTERTPEAYTSLAAALTGIGMDQLILGQYGAAASLISQLRRHSLEIFALPEGRYEQARQALHQFGLRATEPLCADLSEPRSQEPGGALKVMIHLGEEAIDPLLGVLRRTTNARTQMAVLQALNSLGPTNSSIVLEHLHAGESAKVLIQIIPLIAPLAAPSTLSRLAALLQHPDGGVRREAVTAMGQIKNSSVPGILMPMLEDPDPRVQGAVIRQLGESRHFEAVEPLLDRLRKVPPPLQEDICVSLGQIHDPIAIPALVRCLISARGFWPRKPVFSEAVRVRAASALGCFLPEPRAYHALKIAARDSRPLIKQTAVQILRSVP